MVVKRIPLGGPLGRQSFRQEVRPLPILSRVLPAECLSQSYSIDPLFTLFAQLNALRRVRHQNVLPVLAYNEDGQ